jgi:hypothetical protein
MGIVAKANDPELREQLKQHGDEGNTAQGLYIVGADGKFYGWINDHHIDGVRKFLDQGLTAFGSSPPSRVQIPEAALNENFSKVPDPTTSVVRVFSRISPVPRGSDESNKSIGRDHFWILTNEVQQISAPLHDDGQPFALPSPLVARMVRYHLIDNVRGEPDMWRDKEIKRVLFTARFVGGSTSAKDYELHGDFAQQTSDGKRGLEGSIDGRFQVATQSAMISRFRAFARMQAWGQSRFTPSPPPGRFPLVIVMIEANDSVSSVVPPQAMSEWSDYYLNPEWKH